MARLVHVATLRGPTARLYDTVADLMIGTAPNGAARLWTAARAGGGLAAFSLDGPGAAVLVAEQPWVASVRPLADPQLALLPGASASAPLLLAAGLQPGASATYILNESGAFVRRARVASENPLPADSVAAVTLAAAPTAPPAAIAATGPSPPLVAIARAGLALPVLHAPGAGTTFVPLAAAPPPPGEAPTRLVALPDGGLVALWAPGNRIARLDPAPDGRLAATATVGSLESGLGFHIPAAATVAVAEGTPFLILAGAGSSSLTVFRLDGGGLTPVDHVIDSLETRFQTVSALAAVTVQGRTYVLAGGADDGISLFLMLPDGRLVHLGARADSAATALANITALAAGIAGGRVQVVAASGAEAGITQFTLAIGTPGVTRAGPGVLAGTAGDDLILAGPGTTLAEGGAGDDILVALEGGGGPLTLRGGAGADRFVIAEAGRQTSIADFEPGIDTLDLSLVPMLRSLVQVTHSPTATGARLTIRSTVIDIATAAGTPLPPGTLTDAGTLGLSRVFGLPFPVTVNGTAAADRLSAAPGGGTVWGQEGNDTIHGGIGQASLYGGAGNDVIAAGPAGDALFGGAGNDTLRGAEGDDSLYGGTGNDDLDGGAGDDRIEGIAGRNVLRGGAGHDTLIAGAGEDGRGDMLAGGSGDDWLIGGTAADTLFGGPGDDRIWGGSGNDQIFGITGTNRIWGGAGDDFIQGGTGADTIHGERGRNMLLGSLGDDVLIAGPDGDTLFGGGGDDTVTGGAGDDWLYGGLGRDSIDGGPGNDRLWGNWDGATLWGGAGNDTLNASTAGDLLFGGDGNDLILGGRGSDTAFGGAGDDLIAGGEGDDVLFAVAGRTTLWGGAGDDVLHAGAGPTRMTGGAGADTFVFARGALGLGAMADTIVDFAAGVDAIDLTALGLRRVSALTAGGGPQVAWTGGGLALDLDGDGRADGTILMPGAAPPLPGDLLL